MTKKTALTIIGWAISIFLVAALALKLDYRALLTCFSSASWWWLALAAFINIVVTVLKAYRWQTLIAPGMQGTKFWDTFRATIIGMAGNNVMPARGGDWLKIYLLGKIGGESKASLASVAGLDKIFDGLSIVILFGFLSFHSRFPVWVQKGTMIVSVVLVAALAICILLLIHHRRSPSDEETGALGRAVKNFGAGMGALTNARSIIVTFANSMAICLTQVATIWCCQLAFGQHFDVWVGAIVFVAINLAIMVPSAPSGVGPFEVAAVVAYTWLGLTKEAALGIAIMYHAIQFFPITIAGLVFYLSSSARAMNHESRVTEAL